MIDSWKIAKYTLLSVALNLLSLRCSEGYVNIRVQQPCLTGFRYHPAEVRCTTFQYKTQIASSVTTDMDNRNDDSRRVKPQLKLPSIYLNTIGIFLLGWCMKKFTKRWLAIKAGEKFFKAGIYQLLIACKLSTRMANHDDIILYCLR